MFLHKEITYLIQLAINTHIDCANNSKSVFGAFSKQQQGALKVCCASFSVNSYVDNLLIKHQIAQKHQIDMDKTCQCHHNKQEHNMSTREEPEQLSQ